MIRTYRYRIYPTKAQTEFLNGQLREACSLYNAALQERTEAWKICRKSISYDSQCKQLTAMRADGCLSLVNYSCCRYVLRRLDRAFGGFFRRYKSGEKPGYPRYKSYRRYDSLTFTYRNGCRLMPNGKLHIQGAGHIKLKYHRPGHGRIKEITIKRETDRWFACFLVECTPATFPVSTAETGIDVGLTDFAVFSDDQSIKNPRYHKKAEARLRRSQRRVSRRKKGSNRRRKAVLLLQRAHAHVRNQRRDFLHKESRKIVNKYCFIAVEDLNVAEMGTGKYAKSIYDAAWAAFILMLIYKAEDAGRQVKKVNPKGTSQTCLCGASVPKTIRDRWHHCAKCGLDGPRDKISAKVILQRARNLACRAIT